MFLLYKTKKNYYIQVYGDKLLFPSCTEVVVYRLYDNATGRPVKKKVLTTSNNVRYILWDGEPVSLKCFLSFSFDNFLSFFPCPESSTFNNILLYSTLIKYSPNLAFITKARPYTAAIPSLPDSEFDVDNPNDMLFVLSTKGYSVDEWAHNIALTPHNKKYWTFFSDIPLEFDEFVKSLKSGEIKIVDKNKFLEKENVARQEFEQLSKRKQKKALDDFKTQHKIMI